MSTSKHLATYLANRRQILALQRANKAISAKIDLIMEAAGLAEDGPMDAKTMARKLGVIKSIAQGILEEAEWKGFLEKEEVKVGYTGLRREAFVATERGRNRFYAYTLKQEK